MDSVKNMAGSYATIRSSDRQRPPVVGRLLLDITQRLRRSQSLALLQEIERAPFASSQDVAANQSQRLSALLAHAEARVPYYREMFQSLGIKSRDIRSMKDFAELPLLTKDIIRERERDLIADGLL
jgi:phenylacetate-CoA ligase